MRREEPQTASLRNPPAPPLTAEVRGWTQIALTGVLYYAGAKLGMLTLTPEGMVIIWPSSAVALAAMLRLGPRWIPAIGAVVVAAGMIASVPMFSAAEALLFALVNFGEATFACLLLRRLDFDPRFATLADARKFLVAGPVVAAFAASLLGVAVYAGARGGEAAYLQLLRSRWLGDGIGLLLLTPLLLAFPPFGLAPASPAARWRPALADAALLMAALLAVATFWFSDSFGTQLRPFLFVPVALVAAARYPQRWASVTVVLVAVVLVCAMAAGREPFGSLPPRDAAVTAQGFLFIMTLTTLGLAALLGELRRHEAELLARVAARTRELQQANERLERLATVDALTGVGNRRLFDDMLNSECARVARYGGKVSLVLADIDHFKRINDTHGHTGGDQVIQAVAHTLVVCARDVDIVARYGGEEFAVLLPQTSRAQAVHFAERARRAVAEQAEPPLGEAVTLSFGVAELPPGGTAGQLLAAADAALYRAKGTGRNRVVMESI